MLKAQPATAQASSQGAVTFVERTLDHAFASWRNLMIAYWIERTTPAAVLRLNTAIGRLGEEFPEGLGLVQIIHEKAPAPDASSRSALQTMLRGQSETIACSSVVSPGVGFRAASVRALITSLVMLARPKFPHVVHATIEEAVRWHAAHLPSRAAPAEAAGIQRAIAVVMTPEVIGGVRSGLRDAVKR